MSNAPDGTGSLDDWKAFVNQRDEEWPQEPASSQRIVLILAVLATIIVLAFILAP